MYTPKDKYRKHSHRDFLFLGESKGREEFIVSSVVLLVFGVINLIHIFAQDIPVDATTTSEISWTVTERVPQSKEDFQAIMDALVAPTEDKSAAELGYVSWEIVVKFKPSTVNLKSIQGSAFVESFAVSQDMQQVESVDANNIALMKIDGAQDIQQKIDELKLDPSVEYAEPNYLYYPLSFNDPLTGLLRWLTTIKRYDAQNLYVGNPSASWALVAIIDVGVAYDHPELINQMRWGASCKSETWILLWSCLHGYDFVANDKDPYAVDSDHGTHIAWTIAAQANNNAGIVWVNYNARIMAIRAWNKTGFELIDIIKSIDFARQNGAKIINASLGGSSYSSGMSDAINAFRTAWWLFVTAAGNDASNNDLLSRHLYPCDYTLDNIICVAATSVGDQLAGFSNYGSTSVDLWAPGQHILSATLGKTVIADAIAWAASGSIPAWRSQAWVSANRWVRALSWDIDKKLFGDDANPYANNIDSTITWIADTSNADDIIIEFRSECDTQYSIPWTDYMEFWVSADGGMTFWTPFKRDEQFLDSKKLEQDPSGSSSYDFSLQLSWAYASSAMVFRFRRVTDNSDNEYSGCSISDFKIRKYKEWAGYEEYTYKEGTSMATPHVAGLASLARSAAPSFTYLQLKSLMMNTGDPLTWLVGKTVSGKRINARNLMNAVIYSWQAAKLLPIAQYLSWRGIRTNLDTVQDSTIPNFSWLYFAKMSGADEIGRIIFPSEINLFDTGTQNFISGGLANNLGMAPGQVRCIPWTGFIGVKGIIKMNISSMYAGFLSITGNINPNIFTVKQWSGIWAPISNSIITAVASWGVCSAGDFGCSIYLRVDHFTRFDLKPILTNVHIWSDYIDSAYASLWNTVTLNFTGGEILSWVRVTINGEAVAVIWSGRSRTASYYITKINENGPITFSIDYYDVTNTSWMTITGSTDGSSVIMYHNAPSTPSIESLTATTWGKAIVIGTADTGNLVEIRRRNSIGASLSLPWTYVASWISNGTYAIRAPLTGGTNVFRAYAKGIYGSTFTWWESSGSESMSIIKDDIVPTAWVVYTPASGTTITGSVRASVTGFSEEITGLNATGYMFTINGTYLFTFYDLAGNRWIATGRVFRIDNTPPIPTFVYTPASGSATSGNVSLSVLFNEATTMTNNNWSTWYTFADNGAYTFTFVDTIGNIWSATAIVNWIDRTPPSITVTTSTTYTSENITLAWTGNDNYGLARVYVNGALVSGTWSWSTSVILTWGRNVFVISGVDFAGNTTGVVFTMTRLPSISSISTAVTSLTGTTVTFTSDIPASWYIMYGTSSFTMILSWTYGTSHTLAFTWLTPNITYYYQAYVMSNGVTGYVSSTRSLAFPYILPIRWTSDIIASGSVDFWWWSYTSYESNGSVKVYGASSTTDYFEVNLDYLWVQSDSWSWNGMMYGPVQTNFIGNEPSNIDYVNEPDLTYKIWANDTEIQFIWHPATVRVYVGTAFNAKKLRVFRSSTGESYKRIASCYITWGYCWFETDALWYFTMMSPIVNPNAHGAASQGSIVWSKYSDELNTAYLYAYRRSITTIPYINSASLMGVLTREQLAKIIVNFAMKVMEREPDTTKDCYFNDLVGVTTEMKTYIKVACQLDLMGVGIDKFYPKNRVTRAEFGTILSRSLRGSTYNQDGADFYSSHLAALNGLWIIKKIDNPWIAEVRWWVMVMMKRAEDGL